MVQPTCSILLAFPNVLRPLSTSFIINGCSTQTIDLIGTAYHGLMCFPRGWWLPVSLAHSITDGMVCAAQLLEKQAFAAPALRGLAEPHGPSSSRAVT